MSRTTPLSHADRLKRVPATFRLLTGLTPDKFDALLADLAPRHAAAEARRLGGRPGRRRKAGAGRKFRLPLGDRLLMLLMYYRTYVTHAFLGFLFGVDQSSVCRNINPLQPLLAGIFRIPERRVELRDDEVRALFFDATERPLHRPGRRQRSFYSGKKKRHTVKHQVVVVAKRKPAGRPPAGGGRHKPRRLRVAAVSPAFGGRTHDKRAYDRTRAYVARDATRGGGGGGPAAVPGVGDAGYRGTVLRTPRRKPPNGELTRRQKRGNRRLARRRVVVEHAIGKMKIWRAAAERYRNPLRRHTLMLKNVAGLHNLMYA